jgi:hypothetical protein
VVTRTHTHAHTQDDQLFFEHRCERRSASASHQTRRTHTLFFLSYQGGIASHVNNFILLFVSLSRPYFCRAAMQHAQQQQQQQHGEQHVY